MRSGESNNARGQLIGFLSLVFGAMVSLPPLGTYSRSAIAWFTGWFSFAVATEFSFVGVLMGLAGLIKGRGLSRTMSLVGLGLSSRPVIHALQLRKRLDQVMAESLGEDYESEIPGALHLRMSRTPLSLDVLNQGYPSPDVIVTKDVPFRDVGGMTLLLDIYQPPRHLPSLLSRGAPAIIGVHGGAWTHNDKGMGFVQHWRWLASQGYVVFDIQYRLAPTYKFPAHLQDIKAAICWVRKRASDYGVDPERIALLGRSAGAHLSLLAAYTAGDPSFCNGDDRVQAVVALYPPTELTLFPAARGSSLDVFMGGLPHEVPDTYHAASVLDHAKPDVPPTLIIHGYQDELVPPAHSELLHNRLKEFGAQSVLLRLPWSRHGFDLFARGMGGQISQYYTDRFLAWSLYQTD